MKTVLKYLLTIAVTLVLTGGLAARTVNTSSASVLIDTVIPTYSGGAAGVVARYQDANN